MKKFLFANFLIVLIILNLFEVRGQNNQTTDHSTFSTSTDDIETTEIFETTTDVSEEFESTSLQENSSYSSSIDEKETTDDFRTTTEEEEMSTILEDTSTQHKWETTSDDRDDRDDGERCTISSRELSQMRESIDYLLENDRKSRSTIELQSKRIFSLEGKLEHEADKFDILVILLSLASMCIVIATFAILAYVTKLSVRLMKNEERLQTLMSPKNEKALYGFY